MFRWEGGTDVSYMFYMRNQRFSKHTLLVKNTPQQEFHAVLHPILPPKQDFLQKGSLIEFKKDIFFLKIDTF